MTATLPRVALGLLTASLLAAATVVAVTATSPTPPPPTDDTTAPTRNPFPANRTLDVGVGADQIPPGTYVTDGAHDKDGVCYWAVLSDPDGTVEHTIDDDATTGRQRVTIPTAARAFKSLGCDDWTAQ